MLILSVPKIFFLYNPVVHTLRITARHRSCSEPVEYNPHPRAPFFCNLFSTSMHPDSCSCYFLILFCAICYDNFIELSRLSTDVTCSAVSLPLISLLRYFVMGTHYKAIY